MRGLEFTTTNHIAAEAGVDIASLYQYFSNKEDLIEAWQEQLAEDLIRLAGN
ncbi:helix-turn-helix domain-containing protein, partial [Acinetobacter baumannii]